LQARLFNATPQLEPNLVIVRS